MDSRLTDFNYCFEIAHDISQTGDSTRLIEVIERWDEVHPSVKPMFSSLVEAFGFYPYLNGREDIGLASAIRTEYHKSNFITHNGDKITFHFEQKILEEKISQRKNLLVSAPTSFGKSLLIEEFVARREFENILIIQPTLALIDETRKKLQQYDDFYSIIVNTHQEIRDRNLFILTSERVLDILPRIEEVDLLIIDEFYKISNVKKDDRVSHLNIAFYKTMKFNPQLLLLTPSIDSVSHEFVEKYSLDFFKTDYSLVNQELHKITHEGGEDKDRKLVELLVQLDDPTIIYVKSPQEAERLASMMVDNIRQSEEKNFPVFEWIDENISPHWKLKEYLKNGVGLHNGQYPRHIVNSQLEYFNNGNLDYIFATTSLIEGVNSVAKNVVVFDMYKGPRKLTYFDFNNIKGRAGRMMKYYTGNIYYFDNPPKKEEESLDIPIVDQDENIKSEILINIDEYDIKNERKKDYERIIQQIPSGLINVLKNNFYDIEAQLRLYNYLISNPEYLSGLTWQTPSPTYSMLEFTLEIINSQLLGRIGKTHRFWAGKCLQIANNNLRQAIDREVERTLERDQNSDRIKATNDAIIAIFNFIKNQAKYEIPKLMNILQSIVNYILHEKGVSELADYSLFIARLEHEGVDDRLSVLLDFGVPSTALKKLNIPAGVDPVSYIKNNIGILSIRLSNYELAILSRI